MQLDRDTISIVTSFLNVKDITSLSKTSKRLNRDVYYRFFKIDWTSDINTLKCFIKHSSTIEELVVSNYDFFTYYSINLPRLKIIKIDSCTFNSLDILDIYSSTLRKIYIENCRIDKPLDVNKFLHLETLVF